MAHRHGSGDHGHGHDQVLPYTYEAEVDILEGKGKEPEDDHYFSPTICGLVEILVDAGIPPTHATCYGVRRRSRLPLDQELLTRDGGAAWREPPQLCHVLEERFEQTGDDLYRGHVEHGECRFEDRERRGDGPTW
ncbi:MAG: hypothetical protein GY838_05120 [bacterium]|nr:hypothetical protein [bacterium]